MMDYKEVCKMINKHDDDTEYKCKYEPTVRFWLYVFIIIIMVNSCNILGNSNKILEILEDKNMVSDDRNGQGPEPRPPEVKRSNTGPWHPEEMNQPGIFFGIIENGFEYELSNEFIADTPKPKSITVQEKTGLTQPTWPDPYWGAMYPTSEGVIQEKPRLVPADNWLDPFNF